MDKGVLIDEGILSKFKKHHNYLLRIKCWMSLVTLLLSSSMIIYLEGLVLEQGNVSQQFLKNLLDPELIKFLRSHKWILYTILGLLVISVLNKCFSCLLQLAHIRNIKMNSSDILLSESKERNEKSHIMDRGQKVWLDNSPLTAGLFYFLLRKKRSDFKRHSKQNYCCNRNYNSRIIYNFNKTCDRILT